MPCRNKTAPAMAASGMATAATIPPAISIRPVSVQNSSVTEDLLWLGKPLHLGYR